MSEDGAGARAEPGAASEPARPAVREVSPGAAAGVAGVASAVALLALHLMGRVAWCEGGGAAPWTWEAASPHTSQHLIDPYTFTHVLHGVALSGLLALLLRDRLGPRLRFALAIAIEAAWEVLENTDAIIEAYRAGTMAEGYFGDSLANAAGDLAACALGFALARRLPVWASAALFVAVEAALLLWIRDSLLLNVLLLVWPVESIKAWQLGGG